MKKSTKSSLIIFIVTFLVGYVMACFIPDEMLGAQAASGSILGALGAGVAKLIGMRTIIAIAISTVVVLLIRIVDTTDKEEKKTTKKVAKKKATTKKEEQ